MILSCPECATRYVVPDSAVSAAGRTVRCAKCEHSWFQEGPASIEAEPGRVPPPAVPAAPASTPAAPVPPMPPTEPPSAARDRATPRDATVAPEPTEPPKPVSVAREPPPPDDGDFQSASPFERAPPFRPRRNPLKVWTAAAAVFALLAMGSLGALAYWGLPSWVPAANATFGAAPPDLVMDFPPDQQDRRRLPNGTEFFGATGTIRNVGEERARVPQMLIVMRDARGRKVYDWILTPPRRSLAPGESVTINEVVTDVPRSARVAEFGWKPA